VLLSIVLNITYQYSTDIIHVRCLLGRSSARNCPTRLRRKCSDSTVPGGSTVHNVITKVRHIRSVLYKNKSRKRSVVTEEKSDDIGTRLESSPKKKLRILALQCGLAKARFTLVKILLKLRL
jgi:hypothetical protein